MNTLEIILTSGWVGTLVLLLYLFQKYYITRHIFYRTSDWCARKIHEIAEVATYQIAELSQEIAECRGWKLTEEQARQRVPFVILEAKEECQKQLVALQTRLARNGIPTLNWIDDNHAVGIK